MSNGPELGFFDKIKSKKHKMAGMCVVSMFDDYVAVIGGEVSTGIIVILYQPALALLSRTKYRAGNLV